MSTLIKVLEKLNSIEYRFERWFILLIGTSVMLLILTQVFLRYVLQVSMGWYTETLTFFYGWSVFIAIAYVWRINRHIRYGQLVDNIKSERLKIVISMIAPLGMLLFSIFFTVYGIKVLLVRYASGITSPFLRVPLYIENMILPLFGFLLFTASALIILKLILSLKSREREPPAPENE